jgi:thiol-disulfide isomerase/thioredoxin
MAQKEPVAPATPEAVAEWARTLPSNARRQALHGILVGWAESDPVAAIQWAENLDEQEKWVLSNVISTWGRKDPVAASKWVMEKPGGLDRNQLLESLGQAWGGKDRDQALKWADGLKDEQENAAFVGGVAFSFGMNEPQGAIQWAEKLADPKIKEASLVQAVRAWGYRDRTAVEKWLAGLPEGDLKKAAQEGLKNRIVRRRVANSPATQRKKVVLPFETPAELQRLVEAPVNQAREDAITQYVLKWFEQDKEKATQWVAAKLQGWVLAKTAGAVARKWSQSDPVKAAEWVWQVPPLWQDFLSSLGCEWATDMPDKIAPLVLKWREGARRQVILRGVCNAWGQKDPVAALAWTDSLPPGDTRKYARKGLVVGWTCKDDAGCLAWINQLTDASEKKEAQHYRMHGLARIRPLEALKEMESLATDPSDPPTYCVGKEWVLANPQAAADWAKSLPKGSAKERALEAVLRQWVYSDAVKIADWSAKLPEQQSRDTALGAVMEKWVEQSPQQALSWAERQKDAAVKLEGLRGLLRVWVRVDPVESKNWFTQMPAGKDKEVLQEEVMLNRDERISSGEMAPEFSAKTLEGKAFKLSDYRGKHVLLDFWAPWCGPCRGETPNLKAVYEKYGKREDFVMIGLSLDKDVDKPLAYAKENGCAWVDGFLGDWGKDTVTKKYGVHGIPSIFLIGPDGKVVAEGLRGEGIMQAVSGALEQKK